MKLIQVNVNGSFSKDDSFYIETAMPVKALKARRGKQPRNQYGEYQSWDAQTSKKATIPAEIPAEHVFGVIGFVIIILALIQYVK